MNINDLLKIQAAIELLESALDASPDEIIECLEKRLISEEEALTLRNSFQ